MGRCISALLPCGGDKSETCLGEKTFLDCTMEDESRTYRYSHNDEYHSSAPADESEFYQFLKTASDEPAPGPTECFGSLENENPLPPSEWLEETLINLYLSGYSNPETSAADNMKTHLEAGNSDTCEAEEGTSQDEEIWRAQYGQVSQSDEEPITAFPVVDLWDWAMVLDTKEGRNYNVASLVGRLTRRSTKLHPSVPSSGGLFKTAPICEVHLDLVRVTSGIVYKLRTPSIKYIASLSVYDSSDPTKEWGFPALSVDDQIISLSKSTGRYESKTLAQVPEDFPMVPHQFLSNSKHVTYRDRAAERRALHGGIGVGPGQKNLFVQDGSALSFPDTEEAAADALNMSFGAGSYARRILESMGWKEGEALGNTTKGLLEPLQAVGNKGNAGLGWPQSGAKRH